MTMLDKPKRKYPLTRKRVTDAVKRDDDSGFCLACGYEQDGVEPDARDYTCEECGAHKVYGAEELLMMA
jgi:hypothetical protein